MSALGNILSMAALDESVVLWYLNISSSTEDPRNSSIVGSASGWKTSNVIVWSVDDLRKFSFVLKCLKKEHSVEIIFSQPFNWFESFTESLLRIDADNSIHGFTTDNNLIFFVRIFKKSEIFQIDTRVNFKYLDKIRYFESRSDKIKRSLRNTVY